MKTAKPILLLLLQSSLLLFPARSRALDGPGLTNGVRAVRNILGMEGLQDGAMRGLIQHYGWTPEDCTQILLVLEQDLRPRRTDYSSSFAHEVTFSLMEEFATTNALPTLEELLWDPTMPQAFGPCMAYVRISRGDPRFWEPLVRRLDASVRSNDLFAYHCYEEIKRNLQRTDFSAQERRNNVDLLVRRVGEDVRDMGFLDGILNEFVPAWKDSPQRLESAERLLRDHPDSAGARAFAAGITNRLGNLPPEVRASPPELVPVPIPPPGPRTPGCCVQF